jgi:hypothetical protein
VEHNAKQYKTCLKCKSSFEFEPEDTFWDEHGTGYSTKLVKCTECGCINVVEYIEDYGMNVNQDSRFYKYSKR